MAITQLLFTENESNAHALWGLGDGSGYSKDAFHRYVIHGEQSAVNPSQRGTKACAWYQFNLAPGRVKPCGFALTRDAEPSALVHDVDGIFARRIAEADEFYSFAPATLSPDAKERAAPSLRGLAVVQTVLPLCGRHLAARRSDSASASGTRLNGRDSGWVHLYNEDIISMPDKWEYPWYAAWDLGFHTIPLAHGGSGIRQDATPAPVARMVHAPQRADSRLRVGFQRRESARSRAGLAGAYSRSTASCQAAPTTRFLESVFHKLLLNFTWWVNRKDSTGNNIFEGGFLGLDNIGVFDRSAPLPMGGYIEQSDGTSWMAMFCLNMLKIALELAVQVDPIYEDIASKFFEHFLYIAAAMNGMAWRRALG